MKPADRKGNRFIPGILIAIAILALTGTVAAAGDEGYPGMMYGYGYNQTGGYGYPGMMYGYGYNQTGGYGYPGMTYDYGYNQTGGYGYPGMMYGYRGMMDGFGGPQLMGGGLLIFFGVGMFTMIVWMIVGILLIILLLRKLRKGDP